LNTPVFNKRSFPFTFTKHSNIMAFEAAAAGFVFEQAGKLISPTTETIAKCGATFFDNLWGETNGAAITVHFGHGLDTDGYYESSALAALGINYIKTESGGWHYKHQIAISNNRSLTLQFVCGGKSISPQSIASPS
jgi:hypothetical protein